MGWFSRKEDKFKDRGCEILIVESRVGGRYRAACYTQLVWIRIVNREQGTSISSYISSKHFGTTVPVFGKLYELIICRLNFEGNKKC
jgi:hypothetical protein